MAFMSLEINFFQKKKQVLYNFAFFSFLSNCCFFFTNKLPHNTLLVFDEGALEHILRAKVWPYGFQSIFCQVSIDF